MRYRSIRPTTIRERLRRHESDNRRLQESGVSFNSTIFMPAGALHLLEFDYVQAWHYPTTLLPTAAQANAQLPDQECFIAILPIFVVFNESAPRTRIELSPRSYQKAERARQNAW